MDFNNPEYVKNEPQGPPDNYNDSGEISAFSWFLYILFALIPVVNLFFLLANALSEKNNRYLRAFARAAIIWMVIAVIILIIIAGRIL